MIDSFRNALRGLFLLLATERNFQIHSVAFITVIILGFYFDIARFEWASILLISALVLGLEGINTALEKICNEVTKERKKSIRDIKDIAAGSVLIAALIAIGIGGFIFLPYIIGSFQ